MTRFRERAHAAHKGYATQLVTPAGDESEAAHDAEKDLHRVEPAFGADLDTALRSAPARHVLTGRLGREPRPSGLR
jgi:hypothetical protein